MVSMRWTLQAYEKTSSLNSVADSYSSVARFTEHVQLKGGRPRTVEAYRNFNLPGNLIFYLVI
jgi:hypothetical protein